MAVSVNNAAQNALQRILVSDIRVDDVLLNLSPSELKQVRVSNREGQHEMAVITTQISKSQIDDMANKTVTFTYGPKARRGRFYGYVVTVNPNQDYQTDTVVDIMCLGTTWHMQSGEPRFFRDITAPDAAAKVIMDYKLGAYLDYHEYKWPSLAQTDLSDWEFILKLARYIGHAVYVYQGVVRIIDPLRVLQETGVFDVYIKSDDVLDTSRQLLDFNPTTQSKRLRDNLRPSYGFLDVNGRGATSQPIEKPYRLDGSYPVQNRDMAQVFDESWDRRIDAWNHQATARINGNATLIPGVLVGLKVSATVSGSNDHDGTWLVRGVDHSLTNNSFQTQLILARDEYSSVYNSDYRWFYASASEGNPKVLRNDADPSDVRWVSSWNKKHVSGTTLAQRLSL